NQRALIDMQDQAIGRRQPAIRNPQSAIRNPIRGLWWKLLTGLWMCGAILGAFLLVGPARGFTMGGHGAKVIFFHVPCAWLASLAYMVGARYAIATLRHQARADWAQSLDRDMKCAAGMELGLLF